ncbi:hypothetical protein FDUTEX481_07920 [Tolypothrix sp. PCC 7601]|nr:hypothetical protein FDUTEX481_07920 [Tolypothrix sp. PCC 7601]
MKFLALLGNFTSLIAKIYQENFRCSSWEETHMKRYPISLQ